MKKNFAQALFSGLVFAVLHVLVFADTGLSEPQRYSIQATIIPETKQLTAQQTVRFTNNGTSPVEEVYFHIYPNRKYTKAEQVLLMRYAGYFKADAYPDGFDEGEFSVTKVSSEGNKLSFHIEGDDLTLLKVLLPKKLSPGRSVTLNIDFSARLPHTFGRYGWHKNMIKLARWYPILSVYDEDGWHNDLFYPFHRPFFSESAHYSIEVDVPKEMVVIHTGNIVETTPEGSSKRLTIETDHPVRDFSLAMSPDYQLFEGDFDGVAIKSFYLPGNRQAAQKAFENARDMMKFYTHKFGAYPYKQFSIAPVYLGYGGEQMSNMIFIDTRVFELPQILGRYFDFLIAHETGHQWFYNLVGIDSNQEIWLEEGINSYFLMEYLEKKYGYDAEILDLPEWGKKFDWLFPKLTFRGTRGFRYKMISRVGYDHPIVSKLSSFSEPSTIFSLAYGKGTHVVNMLRHQMEPDSLEFEAFDRVFKRIFKEYRFKNLSIKDFMRICQEESQEGLTPFFEQWLFTDKKLDYSVSNVKGNKITFENKGEIQMPVFVRAKFKSGTSYNFWWEGAEKEEVYDAAVQDDIESVVIDPNEDFLDIDRTNNSWPRKVAVHPVPVYWPLYEIPIFLPEDSYNVVVGPEIISNGFGIKASFQKPYDYIVYGATGFEFGEELHHTRAGFQLNNVFNRQMVLGFEIKDRNDVDDDDEDLTSGKLYIRHELWPVQYGFGDINDHVSLYLLRNSGRDGRLAKNAIEDNRNVSYLEREESIVGAKLHLSSNYPYPDPRNGYKLDVTIENSGHFLGATQHFNRAAIDTSFYHPVTKKSKLALRLKYGWGYPNDKRLYELGGTDGLRGYDRKTLRGSKAALGSVEYRFPIKDDLNIKFLDNLLGVESVGGVAFFDAGQSWFKDIDESTLKKNAGFGLRFTVNIGSYLEKIIVRADVAQAINDDTEDTPRFWFGVNHAF